MRTPGLRASLAEAQLRAERATAMAAFAEAATAAFAKSWTLGEF
jgi:hypothetical protein